MNEKQAKRERRRLKAEAARRELPSEPNLVMMSPSTYQSLVEIELMFERLYGSPPKVG